MRAVNERAPGKSSCAGQKAGGQTHTYHTMCTRGSTAKPRTSSNAAIPITTSQRRHVALRMRSCIAS